MSMTKTKILIIEDEPLIARDLKRICSKLGYLVSGIAYESIQALDMLHSRTYDLVLMDINIKGLQDGIEIGKLIREKYDKPEPKKPLLMDTLSNHSKKKTFSLLLRSLCSMYKSESNLNFQKII